MYFSTFVYCVFRHICVFICLFMSMCWLCVSGCYVYCVHVYFSSNTLRHPLGLSVAKGEVDVPYVLGVAIELTEKN